MDQHKTHQIPSPIRRTLVTRASNVFNYVFIDATNKPFDFVCANMIYRAYIHVKFAQHKRGYGLFIN